MKRSYTKLNFHWSRAWMFDCLKRNNKKFILFQIIRLIFTFHKKQSLIKSRTLSIMQHEFKENTEDTCVKKVFASGY